jgi:hypothetical protein
MSGDSKTFNRLSDATGDLVWDLETKGWRSLISNTTQDHQNGVDYKELDRAGRRTRELCWAYYKMAKDDYRWYKEFYVECDRVFTQANNRHLLQTLDDYWVENSIKIIYRQEDGSLISIIAKEDIEEFQENIADKCDAGYSHTRVWDLDNKGWRTLINNDIICSY